MKIHSGWVYAFVQVALILASSTLGICIDRYIAGTTEKIFAFSGGAIIVSLLLLYFVQSWDLKKIHNILEIIKEAQLNGNVKCYNNKDEYYEEATKLLGSAKTEILSFNDYFGASNPILGRNMPASYYDELIKVIRKNKKNDAFSLVTIYHVPVVEKSNISPQLMEFFNHVKEIKSSGKISPIKIVPKNKFCVNFSFAIIDQRDVRITFHGIEGELKQPKSAGGLIILNNKELVKHLTEKFKFMNDNSESIDLKNLS